MDMQTILPYLISAITGIAGWMGGKRAKAATDKKAEAEAQSVEIDNEEKVLKIQLEYIIKPLEESVGKLTKEIRKLRLAINKISDCPYEADCPVRHELQKKEE
jgi:hypothetical protein